MTEHTKRELKRAGGVFLFFLIYALLCCAEPVHIKPVSVAQPLRPLAATRIIIHHPLAVAPRHIVAKKIIIPR